jgi:hypothetical protein
MPVRTGRRRHPTADGAPRLHGELQPRNPAGSVRGSMPQQGSASWPRHARAQPTSQPTANPAADSTAVCGPTSIAAAGAESCHHACGPTVHCN